MTVANVKLVCVMISGLHTASMVAASAWTSSFAVPFIWYTEYDAGDLGRSACSSRGAEVGAYNIVISTDYQPIKDAGLTSNTAAFTLISGVAVADGMSTVGSSSVLILLFLPGTVSLDGGSP
jgi:hypothetical protein